MLDYLGRYVFRIAISNSRLETLQDGCVTFRYRDNRTQQLKRVRLPLQEFIQRFLQHVLPKGLTKVRHYGLSSSACPQRHTAALALLLKTPPAPANQNLPQQPEPIARCAHCGSNRLIWLGQIPPSRKIPP